MKLKIGFGPKTEFNSFVQSGEKVAEVLCNDSHFECAFFSREMAFEKLKKFDIIIFIKFYPALDILLQLKSKGTVLILDYQDITIAPFIHEPNYFKKIIKKIIHCRTNKLIIENLKPFDACLVASEVAKRHVQEAGLTTKYLFRQIYNNKSREIPHVCNDKKNGLSIYWTGVGRNVEQIKPVLAPLQELCEKYHCKIIISSNINPADGGVLKYRRWDRNTWEEELSTMDIAFRWHDNSPFQRLKDSNKTISFMAAALPVVSRPTESEKKVIDRGITGFLVENVDGFIGQVEKLIVDPHLRRKIGQAAYDKVWAKYSLEKHVSVLKEILVDLYQKCSVRGSI